MHLSLSPWQGSSAKGNLAVGSVVLVGGDNSPRLKWPMGVIQRVFPGIDGKIRAVEIKTAKGNLTRSIQRVYDLEVVSRSSSETSDDQPILDSNANNNADTVSEHNKNMINNASAVDGNKSEVKVTQFGQRDKTPARLDL